MSLVIINENYLGRCSLGTLSPTCEIKMPLQNISENLVNYNMLYCDIYLSLCILETPKGVLWQIVWTQGLHFLSRQNNFTEKK